MGSYATIFIIVLPALVNHNSQHQKVTFVETMINNALKSAVLFKYPEDAFQHQPFNKDATDQDFGDFDFIVVGAGASGSVLANRLSENKSWRVLLLEAGRFGNTVTDIPAMQGAVLLSDFNWAYKTVAQKTVCLDMVDQKCAYPRGKGVGGTTLFNGMSYTRGSPVDFDKWAKLNPGWSYKEVLPYFKKSENFVKTDPEAVVDKEFHGEGGELNVEFRIPRHPQTNRWLRANLEKGYRTIDHNGKHGIGASVAQVYKKYGKRQDAGTVFIKPIRYRRNLEVSTGSYVTNMIIHNDTKAVSGVRFVRNGVTYVAKCNKEVILSAGAIGSPQILMLSGIGPKDHLQEIGIPVVENLEVGSTLRDHTFYLGLSFESNYTKQEQPLRAHIKNYLQGVGSLTVPHEKNGFGFYQTKFEKTPNYPNLHLIMVANDGATTIISDGLSSSKLESWKHLNPKGFSMYLTDLHSKSVGTVKLKSSNPFDYPLIDPNLLSDPDNLDLENLYEGLKIALDVIDSKAYREINATLVRQELPACDNKEYLSKEYCYCAFRQFTMAGLHPVGTCPMGPDPQQGAVVDANAKVYGIENLRVVDASIFPFTLSGHPSAPCMMIGEKIADSIKMLYMNK